MKVCPRCSEVYEDREERCPSDGELLSESRDPLVGATIGGRYRLISRLGAGGMSSVHLARHVLIDRLVAVKCLRRELAADPVQRDRFIREARAVNRVNHENIVEITDFGETEDGLCYLVMEYVPGEPLYKAMARGPFPSARALHVVEQIASALGRAHEMGVIHRDLKPENLLLVPREGRPDFIKVLDFGIAKILDAPSLTGSQQIFGTPGYIAPEYIQGTCIDGRADLYSLGVILYELVTGALPFDYEYPGDLLIKHVTEAPIPPRKRRPEVEPAMQALILRCLEKNPARRFQDAAGFLAALRAARERLGGDERWGALSAAEVEPRSRVTEPTPIMSAESQEDLLRLTLVDGPPEGCEGS
jgi:serine/threonine-protein kinase